MFAITCTWYAQVACGSISGYNDPPESRYGVKNLFNIVTKRILMQVRVHSFCDILCVQGILCFTVTYGVKDLFNIQCDHENTGADVCVSNTCLLLANVFL